MSDLRYYITAKNKGEKPYVMFLNWSEWSYTSRNARILDLHIAKDNAAHEPTHCLFVEATDGLQHILSKYFEEERQLSYKVFKTLIKEQNCKTVSTRKEKKQPETQAKETSEPQENKRCYALYSKSADGSIKYFCDEKDAIVVALHKGQRVQIFTQSEAHELQHLPYTDEANADVWNVENIGLWNLGEPQETPAPKADSGNKELSEGYIVYTQSAYQSAYIYYCGDDAKHLDERDIKNAVLFPYVTAVEVAERLAVSSEYSDYTWFVKNKINAAKEETPAPAPEAKKRVGYVLFGELLGGDKVYKNETKVFTMIDGSPADVYMTKEQADFVAYTFNTYSGEFFTWQVEQIEF